MKFSTFRIAYFHQVFQCYVSNSVYTKADPKNLESHPVATGASLIHICLLHMLFFFMLKIKTIFIEAYRNSKIIFIKAQSVVTWVEFVTFLLWYLLFLLWPVIVFNTCYCYNYDLLLFKPVFLFLLWNILLFRAVRIFIVTCYCYELLFI